MWDEHDLSPVLTVISGPMQGASFRLGPGQRVIGRDDGADITIDDRKISRRHATVEVAGGRALLADVGSTNGTWVNDQRVCNVRELRDGDRIRIGHVGMRFFDPAAAATDPVGALRYIPPRPVPPVGASPAPIGGPTLALSEVMPDAGRTSRMLLTIGGCLAMVGSLTWAYLIW